MGGIGLVIIIVFIAIRWSSSAKGVSGDKVSDHKGNLLAVLSIFFLGFIFSWKLSESAIFIYPVFASIFLFPSILSRLTVRLGLVKISYFLGSISYFYFRRNVFAGALMRGLQATHHQRTDEAKRKSLRFLKSRYLRRRATTYSGEMVLVVIIDALLLKPHDKKYMAQQLKLLQGIGKTSIPKCVSVYASKLALAPALANDDQQEIHKLIYQWSTPATNYITEYLRRVHLVHFRGAGFFTRLSCRYRQLFMVKKPLLVNFPKHLKASEKNNNNATDDKKPVEYLFSIQTMEEDRVQHYHDKMLSDNQQSHWKKRAQELGVWQADEAWDEITHSVRRCLSQKSNTSNTRDDLQNEQIDKLQKNLHYICQSVSRRLESNDLGYGVQNFMDWIKIRQILYELKVDSIAFDTAFTTNHNIIWNWVADLWNIKKERCLAHFIANVCAPVAKDCGQHDFYDTLHGIVQGQFK